MSRVARIVLLIAAITVGFTAGRQTSNGEARRPIPLDPAEPDFRAQMRITSWGGGNGVPHHFPLRYELVPLRIVFDGKRVFDVLDGETKKGDIWQIDLTDGRIRMLAQAAPASD